MCRVDIVLQKNVYAHFRFTGPSRRARPMPYLFVQKAQEVRVALVFSYDCFTVIQGLIFNATIVFGGYNIQSLETENKCVQNYQESTRSKIISFYMYNYTNNLYDEYPSRLIRLSLPPKLRATNCSQTNIIINKKIRIKRTGPLVFLFYHVTT